MSDTVWVVTSEDEEGSSVHCVHASAEAAKAWVDARHAFLGYDDSTTWGETKGEWTRNEHDEEGGWRYYWKVAPYVVDQPDAP